VTAMVEDEGQDSPDEQAPGAEADEEATPDEAGAPAPDEEELRRRLEQELRKLRVQDVLLQSVVSLINLTSRRIAKEDERDLEQARVGIDAVRALVDLLEPEPASQVRQALSELQVAYAREAGGPSGEAAGAGEPGPPEGGPKERPPDLWTPPGSAD
jgi:hypothetical protein